jgi:hypothetical protein
MKLFALLAVVLAGCASNPGPLRLHTTHPASPDAAQVPYVAETNSLMAITHLVDVRKPAQPATGVHEHGHEGHERKGTP